MIFLPGSTHIVPESIVTSVTVKISKNIILFDQNKDLLKQENETVSVDGVNGPNITLGSLVEVSTNGNWPTIFDAKK